MKRKKIRQQVFGPYLSNRGHEIDEDILLLEKGQIERDRKKVGDLFNDHYINIIENSTGKKVDAFDFNKENYIIEEICEHYSSHESILKIKEQMRIDQIENFKIKEATEK